MSKVLVTGAAGFIGRHVVPLLAANGHTPRVLVSLRNMQQPGFARDFAAVVPSHEFHAGNLPDAELAERLCHGVDVVVHMAGVAHVNADAAALRTANLDATLELARAAKAQGVQRFIFASSSKARYPAHSLYAQLKADAEAALQELRSADFDVVCVRPSLVYGRGMRGNLRSLLRVLSRRMLPAFPSSLQPLGMISVEDMARALLNAVEAETLPQQIWELSDGQVYTLDGIVRAVRNELQLSQPAVRLPRQLFRIAATLAGLTGMSFSQGTYRALFEEPYVHDAAFSRHTGFVAHDTFFARLPDLLDDML
ncbi:MAG TPA: NAD-dependent epimerase/dehydratase family protein [Pseudomonadales bacterium]